MQQANPQNRFKPPDEGVLPENIVKEVVVGGVYLRLFNQNPGWTVRRPKEFLSELFDACLNVMAKDQVRGTKIYNRFANRVTRACVRTCVGSAINWNCTRRRSCGCWRRNRICATTCRRWVTFRRSVCSCRRIRIRTCRSRRLPFCISCRRAK